MSCHGQQCYQLKFGTMSFAACNDSHVVEATFQHYLIAACNSRQSREKLEEFEINALCWTGQGQGTNPMMHAWEYISIAAMQKLHE